MRFRQGVRFSSLAVFGSLVVLLVALATNLGGDDSLSLYLFVVIALLAWFSTRRAAALSAVTAVGVWLAIDLLRGFSALDPLALYLHAVVRSILCGCVIAIVAAFKEALQRERELARTDPLTGVANARWFAELANGEIRRAQRYPHPFSVAYVDLDNFKNINDRFGHTTGDAVLRTVAQTIKSNIRVVDVVARLGGDEFALVLPETGADAAPIAMQKLRGILLEAMEHGQWPVTFTIGLVTFLQPPESVREMIRATDALMYEGKRLAKDVIQHEIWSGERIGAGVLAAGGEGSFARHIQAPLAPASLAEDLQLLWSSLPFWFWRMARSPTTRVLAGLALITLLSLLPLYLLLGSEPGSSLYPLKRGLEQLQLNLALDPAARVRVHLSLSDRRLDEMSTLLRNGQTDAAQAMAPAYDGEVAASLELIQSQPGAMPLELLQQVGERLLDQQKTLRSWEAQLPAPERAPLERSLTSNQAAMQQLGTVAAEVVAARLNPLPAPATGTSTTAATATNAPVAIVVVTATPTPVPAVVVLPTATSTATTGAEAVQTPAVPVSVPTPLAAEAATATPTTAATFTPTPTLAPPAPPEQTAVPQNTPTATSVPQDTPAPEATATPTPTERPTHEPTSPAPTPTRVPTEEPTATSVPSATPTRTPRPTATVAPSATAMPTRQPTATRTATPAPTATPSATTPGPNGPSCTQQLVVPNLVGLTRIKARKAWVAAGFDGNLIAWQGDGNREVAWQSLRAGSRASVCSSITVN